MPLLVSMLLGCFFQVVRECFLVSVELFMGASNGTQISNVAYNTYVWPYVAAKIHYKE